MNPLLNCLSICLLHVSKARAHESDAMVPRRYFWIFADIESVDVGVLLSTSSGWIGDTMRLQCSAVHDSIGFVVARATGVTL